jgi:hydrogenase maturation protease
MESPDRSRRTLILGIGNPLMGSDAFGGRVIERLLEEMPAAARDVDVADAHTDLLGRIDSLAAYARVVLIDAVLDPDAKLGDAGSVVVLEEETLRLWPETSPSAHQVSPLLAIKLFRQLHPEATTRISLVGLLAGNVWLGRETGAEAGALREESVAEGVRRVIELLS